jgi:hypothetical protein
MPQICDMGQTALLPFRRKAFWGLFRPENPTAWAGSEPVILGTRGPQSGVSKISLQRLQYIRWVTVSPTQKTKDTYLSVLVLKTICNTLMMGMESVCETSDKCHTLTRLSAQECFTVLTPSLYLLRLQIFHTDHLHTEYDK